MARAKPQIVRLADMAPGDEGDFFALLAERTRGQTRDGKPFYTCRFRDARRTASMMVWIDGGWFEACEKEWKAGTAYKLRAKFVESERYGPQIELHNLRPVTEADRADGYDPAEFVEHSRFDVNVMFTELLALCEQEIHDQPLGQLTQGLLTKYADALKRLPASRNRYHPFAGGWLEHTLAVTRSVLWLADRYGEHYTTLCPPLNRDLLVAGAVLHEIGRVLEFDDALLPQPTIPGQLLGHVALGRDLIREAAADQGDLNPELLLLLEHLLMSYLTLPEWGSPRLPLIPESLILHHADDLDAKLEMYTRCLSRDAADGPFTDRDPVLNRQLFKGRTV